MSSPSFVYCNLMVAGLTTTAVLCKASLRSLVSTWLPSVGLSLLVSIAERC